MDESKRRFSESKGRESRSSGSVHVENPRKTEAMWPHLFFMWDKGLSWQPVTEFLILPSPPHYL